MLFLPTLQGDRSVDTYVIAGGNGTNRQYPIISSNSSLNPSIPVPANVWKIVVSEDNSDNANLPSFAHFGFNTSNTAKEPGTKWNDFTQTIGTVERFLTNSNIQYDFFNHLSQTEAQQLKSKNKIVFPPRNSSSLLAEELEFSSNNKNLPAKIGFDQTGVIKISRPNFAVLESNLENVGISPDSIAEITTIQNRLTELNTSHVGTSEVNVFPSSTAPHSLGEISISNNSTTKVDTKNRPFKVDATEIDTFEHPFIPIKNSQIDKISFPSSKSFEEFVTTELLFLGHNSTPEIINNLNNTATNIWSDLLQTEVVLEM